ncbi:hypothetical protein ACWMNP_07325 [Cetobacterium ceti]
MISLQGCSATMALTGDKESNLSVIQKGQNKAIVESQPLKPINTEVLKNGNIVSLYQYTMGNSPSAGRAAVYVLLDATTCFISEIVTMPIEMSKTSEVKIIRIEYTPQGEIIKIG